MKIKKEIIYIVILIFTVCLMVLLIYKNRKGNDSHKGSPGRGELNDFPNQDTKVAQKVKEDASNVNIDPLRPNEEYIMKKKKSIDIQGIKLKEVLDKFEEQEELNFKKWLDSEKNKNRESKFEFPSIGIDDKLTKRIKALRMDFEKQRKHEAMKRYTGSKDLQSNNVVNHDLHSNGNESLTVSKPIKNSESSHVQLYVFSDEENIAEIYEAIDFWTEYLNDGVCEYGLGLYFKSLKDYLEEINRENSEIVKNYLNRKIDIKKNIILECIRNSIKKIHSINKKVLPLDNLENYAKEGFNKISQEIIILMEAIFEKNTSFLFEKYYKMNYSYAESLFNIIFDVKIYEENKVIEIIPNDKLDSLKELFMLIATKEYIKRFDFK